MRFCLFSTFYPPYHFGGDAIFVYRLAHALAERGHTVDVFHSEDAFRLLSAKPVAAGYPEHPGVRRIGLNSPLRAVELLGVQQTGRPFGHRKVLQEAFRPGRYDVMHFHNVSLLGAPEILSWAALTDAVTLFTLHEHWLVCPMHVLWRFDREPCEERTCIRCQLAGRRPPQLWRYLGNRDRAASAVGAFLAPSRFTRDKHLELGFPIEPQLLAHFVPEPPEPAAEPSAARPYFICAGRLEKLKGVDTLIRAFKGWQRADLVIAGDGAEYENLVQLAAGAANIRFVGRLDPAALARYYRAAVALLAPSLCYEVFGLTVVEAFACGAPAIVRDRGALPELIEQSGAGFSYADEQGLMTAATRLLDEPGLRSELGARARAAYLERWTLTRHLERYFDVIDSLRGSAAVN